MYINAIILLLRRYFKYIPINWFFNLGGRLVYWIPVIRQEYKVGVQKQCPSNLDYFLLSMYDFNEL